jgi:phage shock protein E
MKWKWIAAVLPLLALSASLALAVGASNVTSGQARKLIAGKQGMLLLDVRTPEEYRQARLRGSLLIPLNELERRLREIPKGRPLLVYCAVGSRSVAAAGFLASKGYREVYNMSDGLVGWYNHGYPLERGSRN